MKSRFLASLSILTLAGTFSLGALAQTTDEGPGPSEQPSAPMEMGQSQGPDQPYDSNNAQPTEAQPGGPTGEQPATTDQGVARISMIHGDISTQRGDSGDWSAATLNQPVMTGDKVSTADNARTELQLDFANILRLGPNSKANVANLTHKNIQIQLGQGIANYTVSKDSQAEPEIDTPNVSVHPAHHDGVFRIEVRPDGDTLVIVRKGEAQIATPQGSTEVRAGEMATIRGTADEAQYKISNAPDRDDWDRWNADRDHMIQNAQSWKHTNRYYTGSQDLDAYGHWRNVPDYGDVWYPDEGGDWAPYRDGNWVYEPYYGWTWVGYEPWGWAPYHYGRWMYAGGGWGWWPGPVYAGYYPFWAPAYVSFWGWGGGFGFGFGYGGWGGFGWLPIGPCDYFHPWWGGYRGRFGVVNVTNIHITNINRFGGIAPLHGGNRFSNINNIHDNHISRAFSTLNAGHFGGKARPMPVTRQQLGGARMMAGNLPVVPSRSSLSASGRAAAPSTVRDGGNQRFFGTHNNMARPVSFQQQTASLRQTMQQNHVGAVPAGGRVNGGESTAVRGGFNSTQKPSAGTFQGGSGTSRVAEPVNRGGFSPMNNNPRPGTTGNAGASRVAEPVNRGGFSPMNNNTRPGMTGNSGSSRVAEPVNRGGFRPFTPPSSSNRPSASAPAASNPNSGNRGFEPFNGRSAQPQSNARPAQPLNRDGFRPFTPPSQSQPSQSQVSRGSNMPENRSVPETRSMPQSRGSGGGYWDRTAPSSQPSSQMHTNGPVYGGSERGSSRPQLDMRQPVVRPPSYGGYPSSRSPSYSAPRSMPNYGGSHGAPSYSAPRSTPSYGGSHSAPSYSAPRSSGGGGHVSAPSGGGHSAPSAGGGHSSGGSHSSSGHR